MSSGRAGCTATGVSVVIPLQDEEQTIESLLRSLAAQTLQPREIILVDAGSHDETVRRALAVGEGLPIRIVSAGRVYPGVARNAGVQDSTQDWIAFTDGGVVTDVGWLAGLVERAKPGTDVVFGNYEPVCDTRFKECSAIAYVSARNRDGMREPFVASCLVRRSAFDRAGGFPAFRAAEDLIFIRRLSESGAQATSAPTALVRWQIAGSVATTFKRFASYSFHNLVAGWAQHWHAGTVRLYLALTAVLVVAVRFAGGAWAAPAALAFFLVRAVKAAYQKRRSFDFRTTTPMRIVGTAGILVLIDLATLVGFIRWIIAGRPR